MINLPGGYAMDADDYCYIIGKPYTSPKDGKVILQKKTYYTRLEDALDDCLKRCARDAVADGSVTELAQLVDCMSALASDLTAMLPALMHRKTVPAVSAGESSEQA